MLAYPILLCHYYRSIDMKVLVTGCYGQVGQELMKLAPTHGCVAVGFDHDALDITNDEQVQKVIEEQQPNVVINAAAYTAVDKAEGDADAAFAVNVTGVKHLAEACADLAIPFVHISTDYVFDGSKHGTYMENDAVCPLGVYGETKLAGEEAVRSLCELYYILRTSWVFSAHGNNFVKTILRLGAERQELSIVADQRGKPTSAREIAHTIYMMLTSNKQAWGTYHLAQPEAVTWFDFAEKIFDHARVRGVRLKLAKLHAITTKDYPTPAKRPANSELDCAKLERVFDLNIKPWEESLSEVIKDLKNNEL